MKSLFKLALLVSALAQSGLSLAYDPLKDYQQVEPAAVHDLPKAAASAYPQDQLERGRYLVDLLGCANCHTDGALLGEPDAGRALAGSRVGIATSNPMEERLPGVVYASNLTPDSETGLGDWTPEDIAGMLRTGEDSHGFSVLPVMPWMIYSRLLPVDAMAIAMYLKSLPAVKHKVPDRVKPGSKVTGAFVHFGVYRERQKEP